MPNDEGKYYYTCAECTIVALRATASPHKAGATSQDRMKIIIDEDLVNDVQWIGGFKDTSRPLRKRPGETRTPQSFYDDVVRWEAEQKEDVPKGDAIEAPRAAARDVLQSDAGEIEGDRGRARRLVSTGTSTHTGH